MGAYFRGSFLNFSIIHSENVSIARECSRKYIFLDFNSNTVP
jgi:hypothetical protein